jgi:hypothetical protein
MRCPRRRKTVGVSPAGTNAPRGACDHQPNGSRTPQLRRGEHSALRDVEDVLAKPLKSRV